MGLSPIALRDHFRRGVTGLAGMRLVSPDQPTMRGRSSHRFRRLPEIYNKVMTDTALTDHIITQGCALVRAIEALGTIEPTGPFEQALARLLPAVYKRRLRGIVEAAPARVSEEILSASEHTGDQWAALWMSDN